MLEECIRKILQEIGEDPAREELKQTPARMVSGYKHIFSGYGKNYQDIIGDSFIKGNNNDIVLFNNMKFISTCEHHFLPFYGCVEIAYIPNQNLLSLGRAAGLVLAVTRKMQIQERITFEVANALQESSLSPAGVSISVEAKHFCACASGELAPSTLKTFHATGEFRLTDNLFKLSLLLKNRLQEDRIF